MPSNNRYNSPRPTPLGQSSQARSTQRRMSHAAHIQQPANTGRHTRSVHTARTPKRDPSLQVIIVLALGAFVIVGILIALISCKANQAQNQKVNYAASPHAATSAPVTPARATTADAGKTINTGKDAIIVDYDQDGILATVPEGFTETTAYIKLVDAIDDFESHGYSLGFSLLDLNTGRSLNYNADTAMYPASSIKAAYVAMVYETHGGAAGMSSVAENCIVNSDNESFHRLIQTFGLSSYANWLIDNGAENAGKIAYIHYYPNISSTELSNVWQEIYRYGVSGEKGSEEFTGFLAQSNHTSMGGLLRNRYTVWAKPGWYPADGTNSEATVDAGVVFSDCGPYVFVVMSDAPEDFTAMFPLEDALNAAHGCMCGGSSEPVYTSSTTLPGV